MTRKYRELAMASTTVANLHYWHAETQDNDENMHEAKIMRRPMFIVNNLQKQEFIAASFEKKIADQMHFINENMDTKHFLAPLGSFEITDDTECNDIENKETIHSEINMQMIDGKSINSNVDVQGHNDTPKLRPFSCSQCDKTFLLKHHLTTHIKTHTGERPHACVHCGKTFTHKHCLNTHLLLHSSNRPYRCAECKKSFTLKHHLLSHSRVILIN